MGQKQDKYSSEISGNDEILTELSESQLNLRKKLSEPFFGVKAKSDSVWISNTSAWTGPQHC